jgi:hypothetical protein
VVDTVFQLGSTHLELLDFLVRGEINFLLDPVNGIVEAVIFIEKTPEMVVRPLQASDGFAMFRKLSQDGMMEVHGTGLLFRFWTWFVVQPRGGGMGSEERVLASGKLL